MDTIPINVHRNTPPLPESGEIKTPIRGHDWFHLIPAKNRERERANCKKKKRERMKRKRSHRTVIWLTPSDTDACLCVNVQGCRSISPPPLLPPSFSSPISLSLSLPPLSSPSIFLRSPLYLSQSVQAYRRASIYPDFSPGAIKVSANHATRQPLGRTISRFVHWLVRFPLGQSRQLAPALRRVLHTLLYAISAFDRPRTRPYICPSFLFSPYTRGSLY